jgi:hypothetical protein
MIAQKMSSRALLELCPQEEGLGGTGSARPLDIRTYRMALNNPCNTGCSSFLVFKTKTVTVGLLGEDNEVIHGK